MNSELLSSDPGLNHNTPVSSCTANIPNEGLNTRSVMSEKNSFVNPPSSTPSSPMNATLRGLNRSRFFCLQSSSKASCSKWSRRSRNTQNAGCVLGNPLSSGGGRVSDGSALFACCDDDVFDICKFKTCSEDTMLTGMLCCIKPKTPMPMFIICSCCCMTFASTCSRCALASSFRRNAKLQNANLLRWIRYGSLSGCASKMAIASRQRT
mmetsp:Transcript_34646/g.71522  ORF Transcript_34646/g.71522 Transcript_34646/m.71522 type:complete len:209 (+) Transcript_34646:1066-1692(+)